MPYLEVTVEVGTLPPSLVSCKPSTHRTGVPSALPRTAFSSGLIAYRSFAGSTFIVASGIATTPRTQFSAKKYSHRTNCAKPKLRSAGGGCLCPTCRGCFDAAFLGSTLTSVENASHLVELSPCICLQPPYISLVPRIGNLNVAR